MWFPTVGDVIDLHRRILDRGGGHPGVLNPGAIESALHRARWGPFARDGLPERAAFLFRGIAQDHPFVDGNKRTAFELVYLFLYRNGYDLDVTDDAIVETTVHIARGELSIPEIAAWLRGHMENL